MHKIIVMMGGQGVGKGTLSQMLVARGNYTYIETGAMLRAVSSESDIGRRVARGELVSDDDLFALVSDKFNCDCDVVLDGFPRTRPQAQWLVQNYADNFDIHVIYLDAPREVMLARINKRIREGGGRADDSDALAVERRLNTFFDTTMPAIEWLRSAHGIHFADVDGTGTIDENMSRVLHALGEK